MIIYTFARVTKEYLNTTEAKRDPLDPTRFLIPALATTVPVPEYGDNQKAVFDIDSKTWSVVDDFRGLYAYNTETKHPYKVQDLGPLKEGFTVQVPGMYDEWSGTEWAYSVDLEIEHHSQNARIQRQQRLESVLWYVERHAQETQLGIETTFNQEEILELYVYIQDLRDVPQQPGFPKVIQWPQLPSFIEEV